MSLNLSYCEREYDFPIFLFPRSDEPGTEGLALRKFVLEALGASVWQVHQQTFGYRLMGTDTLDFGNQNIWIQIKQILSLFERHPGVRFPEARVAQSDTLLDTAESQRLHRSSSLLSYMRQVEIWADAYDKEASAMSLEECEALYDDAFFEAMDLEKKLP